MIGLVEKKEQTTRRGGLLFFQAELKSKDLDLFEKRRNVLEKIFKNT